MSLHAVERVFWEFGQDQSAVERFQQDPDAYLDAFALEEEERRAIKEVDLKSLSKQGMNPLLLMMTWPLLKGLDGYPFVYLEHLNDGKMPQMSDLPEPDPLGVRS